MCVGLSAKVVKISNGTGLAGVEIKDHIKNSFFWIWGVSIICLISGIILGVIKF